MSWVMSINPWATLVVAGLLEVLWASGLKNVGVSRPWTSLGVVIALAGSMILLWVATQKLPIGTAYAVWTGIGTAGTFLIGIIAFNDSTSMMRILSFLLIAVGLIGLRISGQS